MVEILGTHYMAGTTSEIVGLVKLWRMADLQEALCRYIPLFPRQTQIEFPAL